MEKSTIINEIISYYEMKHHLVEYGNILYRGSLFNDSTVEPYKKFEIHDSFTKINVGGNRREIYTNENEFLIVYKMGLEVVLRIFDSKERYDEYVRYLHNDFGNSDITITINEIKNALEEEIKKNPNEKDFFTEEKLLSIHFRNKLIKMGNVFYLYKPELAKRIVDEDKTLTIDEVIKTIHEKNFRWKLDQSQNVAIFMAFLFKLKNYFEEINPEISKKINNSIIGWS